MSNVLLYFPRQSRYEILRTISEGSFGKVVLARDKVTTFLVAIKIVSIKCSHEGVPSSVIREVAMLKELEHENIIRLFDVFIEPEAVYIILEYISSNLHSFIRMPGNQLDQPLTKVGQNILRQILKGVAYCHSNKILHRDLKPMNLLYDADRRRVKIADFGLARAIEVPPNILTDKIGTLCYRAPETLLGSTNYTEVVDIWAVGCIFAEMVIRKPLFYGMCNEDVLLEIFKFFGVPSEYTWPGVSSLRKDISTAYEIAPEDKKSLSEVLQGIEPAGLELLKLMLSVNPTSRITAHMALDHQYFKESAASARS